MQALKQRTALPASRGAPCRPAPRAVGSRALGGKDAALAGGKEWIQSILSRFGPATDRAQNITTLEFEKPLLELDKRIKEVRGLPDRGTRGVGVMGLGRPSR
jgi:acetyl-CoA carboxylase carboxyl transferase subunit alpha